MRAVTIGQNEAGQRLDKFLNKYMKEAGVSFFYKMMRKKNIQGALEKYDNIIKLDLEIYGKIQVENA